jgi:hypothetical protein
MVELEWPAQMRLGDSDTLRLSLIPSKAGYIITAEFPEHQTLSESIAMHRPDGYDLQGIARLDGTGFDLSPQGDQTQILVADSPCIWRWSLTPRTAGQHRLALQLSLRFVPQSVLGKHLPEQTILSRALTVKVTSFLGMDTQQAAFAALAGLVMGGTFSAPLLVYLWRPRRKTQRALPPNPRLVIEQPAGILLSHRETSLLQALFGRYARLTLEAEFRSGYSGARTFLALPIRADGRADAYTIAKLGQSAAIQREYANFETFVKDTLPPITARIQETPVTLPGLSTLGGHIGESEYCEMAIRYTFIGEPGRSPTSLRQALLAQPDSGLLDKMFATFGPHWWMQRKPYTFRVAEEYDRVLPSHFTLEPVVGHPDTTFDGRISPAEVGWKVGDIVKLQHFAVAEKRADGKSLSLIGKTWPGQPPLRLRWLSLSSPDSAVGRIISSREKLLQEATAGMDRIGLPDPFARLPSLLSERVIGTQSIIHGDLNLENILVGPGGIVWLIDFAQTREGHPLFDFAHLEAEIIAHIIAPSVKSPLGYLEYLKTGVTDDPQYRLLATLRAVASRCLFNPNQPREYELALFMACVGALKFPNLAAHQRQMLYLTAAYLASTL